MQKIGGIKITFKNGVSMLWVGYNAKKDHATAHAAALDLPSSEFFVRTREKVRGLAEQAGLDIDAKATGAARG